MNRDVKWLRDEKHGNRETPAFSRDLERLRRGEHIDYVIGWANFLGVKVDLTARPLIPRPETEFWVERVLQKILREAQDDKKEIRKNIKVLDLFCGSGCIGLAVLKHAPRVRVDFADIEPRYVAGIKKSLRSNKLLVRRARFFTSDVLKNIDERKYDFILANPPYIPTEGRHVAQSVLKQEPRTALFAGKDGLRFIRTLLRQAKHNLKPKGELIFEFDPPQKKAITAIAQRYRWQIEFKKDQYKRFRYAVLKNI